MVNHTGLHLLRLPAKTNSDAKAFSHQRHLENSPIAAAAGHEVSAVATDKNKTVSSVARSKRRAEEFYGVDGHGGVRRIRAAPEPNSKEDPRPPCASEGALGSAPREESPSVRQPADIEVSTEQLQNTQWPCNSLQRRRFVFDGAIGFGLEQQTEDPSIDNEQQQPPYGDQLQVPRTLSLSDLIGNFVFCNARAHHADLPTLYASVARPRCDSAPSHKPPPIAKCRQASLLHESGASANI